MRVGSPGVLPPPLVGGRRWGEVVLDSLDLAAALLLVVVVNGVRFGGTDDAAFVPWVFRLENPELYPTDIRFQTLPHPYYAFHLAYFYAVSRVMPIEWALVGSTLAWILILLVALRQVARQISGQEVSAVCLALLIAGYQNNHLVGGYYLTSPSFSTHYPAIALSLLGMTAFHDGRGRRMALALLLAALFNPRLGIVTAGFVLLFWLRRGDRSRKLTVAGIGALVAAGVVGWLSWRGDGPTATLSAASVAYLELFVRSRGHTLPAAWDPFVFVNLALVTVYVGLLWRRLRGGAGRDLGAWALLCLGGIFLGLLNNTLLLVPALVVANPFQLGPFVLAVVYAAMAAALVERIQKRRYLVSLTILVVPDLQARIFLLLAAHALDEAPFRALSARPWLREALVVAGGAVAIAIRQVAVPAGYQQIPYDGSTLQWRIAFLGFVLVVTTALVALKRASGRTVIAAVLVGSLLMSWESRTVDGIRINFDVTPEWREVCEFVRRNTPTFAAFVTNPDRETANFQYLSRRSVFANFVLVPLNPERVQEWLTRLERLRFLPPGLSLDQLRTPVRVDGRAYDALRAEDLLRIKERYDFVEYAVVERKVDLPLELFFENRSYRIYRLAVSGRAGK